MIGVVVLSFSERWKEVLNKSKCQTIRYNWPYWREVHRAYKCLHMWCPGPRSGHGIAVGRIPNDAWSVMPEYGRAFGLNRARLDGFETVSELVECLAKFNRITHDDVSEHEWAVITWRPWMCPSPVGKRKARA